MKEDLKGFCEYEARNDLFSRQYLGVPYWQVIRTYVYNGIFLEVAQKKVDIRKSKSKILFAVEVLKKVYAATKAHHAIKRIGQHELIRFHSSVQHDRFYDYWHIPDSIDTVDIVSDNGVYDAGDNEKFNILEPYLKANISYIVKKEVGMLKKDVEERKRIDFFVEELKQKYGRCPSSEAIEKEILRYVEYYKFYKPFFEELFGRVQCKAILVVWYYQTPLMIAYEVAKQRNIQVIELQHGGVNEHKQYWFEDQRGINNHIPDFFLAFGEQHIRWMKMLPMTRCLAVGNPCQDVLMQRVCNMETEEKTVVIYPESEPEFERMIDSFANKAASLGYRIIVKIHPLESDGFDVHYPRLSKNKNVEVITDQSKGIYYWLKLGKYHVMSMSTVGFEALVFPHTNICIPTNVEHGRLQCLLEWHYARGFSTDEELMTLVRFPMQRPDDQHREELWKSGGARNIELFFKSMQEQGWPRSDVYKTAN